MTSSPVQKERIAIIERLNRLGQANSDIGHRQMVLISAEAVIAWELISDYLEYPKSAGSLINSIPLDLNAGIVIATPKYSQLENKLLSNNLVKSRTNIKLCRPDKPNTLLGFDCKNGIIDCSKGFYPDALTAIAGTIRPGGILFIMCPPLAKWPTATDDFASKRTPYGFLQPHSSPHIINRFISACLKYQSISLSILNDQIGVVYPPEKTHTAIKGSIKHTWNKPETINNEPNEEQSKVLKLIYDSLPPNQTKEDQITKKQVYTKKMDKPLIHVIRADRGRGKSHLLGHLISLLISRNENLEKDSNIDNGINFYITAPNKAAIQSVAKVVDKRHGNLHFIAPENVLNKIKSTDILLIDEAASLPLPQLMSWAAHFKTVIFATTTHGYEGTGKGFQIRFINYLKTLSNNIHQHHLTTPIRYAENDPLEQAMFTSFALNSEPQGLSLNFSSPQIEQAQSRLIPQQELADNPALLEELFSLLVQAHYQTRPSDIRDLLDAPGMAIYGIFITASNKQYLASGCLISFEGNFNERDRVLIDSINKGIRRPQGHLLPQVLTLHMNQKTSLLLAGARVIRIATLANLQKQNLGSKLISFVSANLSQQNIDYLGSSYANTQDVNSFWDKNEFTAVRSGKKRDKASGTFSTVVIKGLSKKGKALEESCLQFHNDQQTSHLKFKSLSANEKDLIQNFIKSTGSYEAIKDILCRCSNWPSFYDDKPFPKKAKQDLRDSVESWSQT
ncbi:MAG: tRNA(Met) cytidine acetyltransferase [Bermanella sp.]|jgi:tRNA(Met) cytidine acetyltransferase